MSLAALKHLKVRTYKRNSTPTLNVRSNLLINSHSSFKFVRPLASTAFVQQPIFKQSILRTNKKTVSHTTRTFSKFNIPDLSSTDYDEAPIIEDEDLEEEEQKERSLMDRPDSELTPQELKLKQWEIWKAPFIAYQLSTGANAVLSEKTKKQMWETYKSDPKFWTLGNIAGKFKVSLKRAYAVLVDKRHEEIEEIISGQPLDSSLVERFEKRFAPFVEDSLPQEMEDDDTVTVGKPRYEFVDYEVDPYKAARLFRQMGKTGFGVLSKDELPDEPPLKAMDGLEVLRSQALILKKGTVPPEKVAELRKQHNIPEGGGKLIIMDNGIGKQNYKREMYVIEIDGTVRTASWKERKELTKQPPRRSLFANFAAEMEFLENYLKKSLEEKARLANDPAEQKRIQMWRDKIAREEARAEERKKKAEEEKKKLLQEAKKAVGDAIKAEAKEELRKQEEQIQKANPPPPM